MKSDIDAIETRFLRVTDIDALMHLEKQQWSDDQRPTEFTLRERIKTYPTLCIGAFCHYTGRALASLFLKPVCRYNFLKKSTWNECANVEALTDQQVKQTRDLFGISLTSIDPQAADAIFAFFYACCMKEGWRAVYLGSPIPGFKKFMAKNTGASVEVYVNKTHKHKVGLPYDPQLRYYYKRGFHHIVSIQKDYFPHEEALDYGVIVMGKVPFYRLSLLLQFLPRVWLQYLCKGALRISHRLKPCKKERVQLAT